MGTRLPIFSVLAMAGFLFVFRLFTPVAESGNFRDFRDAPADNSALAALAGNSDLDLTSVPSPGAAQVSVQGAYYGSAQAGQPAGNVSINIPWESDGKPGRLLAYVPVGLIAYGMQQTAYPEGDLSAGLPNTSYQHLKWVLTTGHPFSASNQWEQNSGGKPLVFVNVYGHGMLGIFNMEMADKLFPDSPLLAVLAASLMYDVFEFYGEGSASFSSGSQGVMFENNDFIISQVIPIMGSQAFADAFKLNEKLSPATVASAQAIVYALMSGKKMTKADWLKLGGYPVMAKLYEHLKFFRGRNGALDKTMDNMATTFGFSSHIGSYGGLGYTGVINGASIGGEFSMGSGGQRIAMTFRNDQVYATAYAERSGWKAGPPDSYGLSLGADIKNGRKNEMAILRASAKKEMSGYFRYSFEELDDRVIKRRARELKVLLLEKVDTRGNRGEVARLLADVNASMGRFHKLRAGDKEGYKSVLTELTILTLN